MIAAISARTGGQPSRRVWSARRHGNEGLAESDPVKRSLGKDRRPHIVRFSRSGGQGVVVPGGFIVTAAHCIAQRERYLEVRRRDLD
jgi:hypothetical protein